MVYPRSVVNGISDATLNLTDHNMFKKIPFYFTVLILGLLAACGGEENNFTDFIPVAPPEGLVQTDSFNLTKRRVYSMTAENFKTSPHFIVWWGRRLGTLENEVDKILEDLENSWEQAIVNYGMNQPPDNDVFYSNVYLTGTGDGIPEDLGTSVLIDFRSVPYITLGPTTFFNSAGGANTTSVNTVRQAFNFFLTQRTSFFDDTKDNWFREGAGTWFVQQVYPDNEKDLDVVVAVGLNPQLPIWTNTASLELLSPGRPLAWSQINHAAGTGIFFTYLTENGVLTPAEIGGAFAADTNLSSLQFINDLITAKGMDPREVFSAYCAHNVTWDYTRFHDLYTTNQETWANDADQNFQIDNSIISTIAGSGTTGWLESNPAQAPGGWAYNVYRLNSDANGNYNFQFEGDNTGKSGTESQFLVTTVRKNGDQRVYQSMSMTNGLTGSLDINATADGEEIYLVITSVPDLVEGYETFDYRLNVTKTN